MRGNPNPYPQPHPHPRASAECEAHFPQLIERNAELRFLLRCQAYIELVRAGKG